jgi:uncharacterized membrane protein YhaH (DUF805 family)
VDRLRQFISFNGRSGRRAYWFISLPLSLLLLICAGIAASGGEDLPLWAVLAVILGIVASALPIVAVSVRRLHDRNRSGAWLLLYMVVPALFGPDMTGEAPLIPLPAAVTASLALLSSGVSIWAFVDLGVLKGSPSENRFGLGADGRAVGEVFS